MQESNRVLSVVVPVYFNAESLPYLFTELARVEAELMERNVSLELIFVNDGSRDDSLKQLLLIKNRRPQTKIISLSRNFGAVSASKTGFAYVSGDAFTLLAADLQDPPKQLLLMVDEWLKGSKFVISARRTREDPAASKLWAWLYYRIIELFVSRDYPRRGFDLMLMDKLLLPHMLKSARNTNPNMYAFWLGFQPTTLYYDRVARRHGKSRWTFSKKLKFFFDTICGFSVVPIRAMSVLGVIAATLGSLYGIDISLAAFLGRVPVQGFATLAALVSFFSGLILVMLGTLGEYLWRVFDVVNNKPETVIDETFL
jgi:glycosyltransferase involved in cell wall biosynthesis